MSFEVEKKNIRHELKAGVHLVTIHSMKKHLDSQKNPIIKNGEIAVLITFSTGTNPNLYHDQIYWIGKGKDGLERYFTRMCIDAGIDMSKTPLSPKDAIGKRLWIGIREVYTLINNGEEVLKDIGGNPVLEHFIFQTSPVFDPEKPPTWKGDPAKNNGEAADEFVGYKEENESGYDTVRVELPKATTNVLEVGPVTPEVEKAMAEIAVEKTPKAKISEPVSNGLPNFGDTQEPDYVTNELAADQLFNEGNTSEEAQRIIDSTSSVPNFGDSPDTNFG